MKSQFPSLGPTVFLAMLLWATAAFGGTILDAAKAGDVDEVKTMLVENPLWISYRNSFGYTPLHSAAAAGHQKVVELLLANGAEVNARNNGGETPYHLSAIHPSTPRTSFGMTAFLDAGAYS